MANETTNVLTKKPRKTIQFEDNELTIQLLDLFKTDTNIRSDAEASRILIKKGYDQHLKEKKFSVMQ